MRVVVWNVERKRPDTPTGLAGVERITVEEPELAVLTEARVGHLSSLGGYEMASHSPAGERFAADERTVIAWSRNEWRDIDQVGDPLMPPGRFAAATTRTSIGDVRVIAICIPWHMCDVRHGSKDRKPWEQHLIWLERFRLLIEKPSPMPTIIAGDFNQRVPARPRTRKDIVRALAATFEGFEIVTAGMPAGCDRQGIDHIALGPSLEASVVRGWPNNDGGVRMSDHDAVVADINLRS